MFDPYNLVNLPGWKLNPVKSDYQQATGLRFQ